MTTPETPDEGSEEAKEDSPSSPLVPPPDTPSTNPAPPRSFSFRNRWVLIGGSIAGVVVVAIIAVVVVMLVMGGGVGGPVSTLELIPADSQGVFLLNLQAARDNEENFPGDFDDFAENIQEEIEEEFDTEEIDIQQVSNFSVVELGYDWGDLVLLEGDFSFDDIRDDWEDQGHERDSYKGYELWDGRNYYALLEAEGAVVAAYSEEIIKDVIKNLDRGSGSLADAEDNDLKLILDKFGGLPAAIAIANDFCDDDVSGCIGFGMAYAGSDLDREEVFVDLVVLFSSERRAERVFEDYDDVDDLMENVLDSLADSAEDFSGVLDVDDVDVDDISNDGVFVLGTGIIDVEE